MIKKILCIPENYVKLNFFVISCQYMFDLHVCFYIPGSLDFLGEKGKEKCSNRTSLSSTLEPAHMLLSVPILLQCSGFLTEQCSLSYINKMLQ